MITYVNKRTLRLIISIIIALPFMPVAQAGNPGDPVAHWAFEEGALQVMINNANPGTYNGYRGRTSLAEADYDAPWVSGLNGSSSALQFSDYKHIATITEMADDTNGDRVADSGPLAGSFSMFMRVNMPNDDYQPLMTADKGPTDTTRGFYFDTQPSSLDGATWRLGLRISFNSPTNSTWYTAGGQSGDIAVTNVDSIGFTFLADPDPSDANNDGILQFYVNGSVFYSAKTHNAPYVGVSGNGLWFGNNFEPEPAKGIIIDDVAIWDKALTADEMMYVETNALPQPEPGPEVNPGYPYAHWPFDEGSGETVKDIRDRTKNNGYLGSSPSDTSRNPTWVTGLNGSSSALQYDNTDMVAIDDIANDTNNDNIADSGPFSGTFTLFARVSLPNTNRLTLFNMDKESPITDRGFYTDIYNSYLDASGDWHVGTRFVASSPTNTFFMATGGSASTPLNTNVQNIIITFTPDDDPSDTVQNGRVSIYFDRILFASQSHNTPYIGVSGNNKFWLGRDTYNISPNGLIMDDVAIWNKVLTDNEMYYIINTGVPIQPPAGTLIIVN